jgi:hypothetical protein
MADGLFRINLGPIAAKQSRISSFGPSHLASGPFLCLDQLHESVKSPKFQPVARSVLCDATG